MTVCIKSQQSWSNPVDAELDFKYVQSGANDGTFSTSECHLKKASKKQIDITGEWTLSSCHDGVTVCLEHPQCHEATLFCGLINCKSSMTWMTWQVSEIASLLFTIWILVSLGGIPYVKASETSRTGNSNSRSDRKFLSC